MVVNISVAVIAVAFVILVIFLIIMFLSITKAVQQIEKHLRSLDSLFQSASNVGDALEVATQDLKEKLIQKKLAYEYFEENPPRKTDLPNKVAEGLTFAALVISLWNKIKKRS